MAKYGVLIFFALLTIYPLLLVVSTALKDPLDVGNPFSLFSSIRLANIADAWTLGRFGAYFMNTVYITVPTVVGVVVLSVMAGYALARINFPGRTLVFFTFMLGLMIPFTSVMIPLFYELQDLRLFGSLWAVILPAIGGAAGFGVPLGVFLMRSFFQDLPNELAEAARVDGATEFQVFRRVMLPLSAPGIAVLAVLTFFQSWNQFLMPLLFLPGEENRTLATGLYIFNSGRTAEYELIASASLIMIVPVVIMFLLFQRQFVKGLTAGAVKG
ncbi:MAG: carbohydrate ABC transporter permease [Actinobacteria bacterium]|nr:carbohydrate ABC transporter permease [Actinomycetota bacterium]